MQTVLPHPVFQFRRDNNCTSAIIRPTCTGQMFAHALRNRFLARRAIPCNIDDNDRVLMAAGKRLQKLICPGVRPWVILPMSNHQILARIEIDMSATHGMVKSPPGEKTFEHSLHVFVGDQK